MVRFALVSLDHDWESLIFETDETDDLYALIETGTTEEAKVLSSEKEHRIADIVAEAD